MWHEDMQAKNGDIANYGGQAIMHADQRALNRRLVPGHDDTPWGDSCFTQITSDWGAMLLYCFGAGHMVGKTLTGG